MAQKAWSNKRERQYDHIKESLIERGRSKDKAEEIAVRTVNTNRAQAGEAKESSRVSREDTPSSLRGGFRSRGGSQGRTRAQLYEDAKRMNIKGRSDMNKEQLRKAVDAKK